MRELRTPNESLIRQRQLRSWQRKVAVEIGTTEKRASVLEYTEARFFSSF